MTSRTFGNVNVSGNSNTVTLGDFGDNAVVGTNATAINAPVDPEVLAAVHARMDTLTQSLASFAHAQKLSQEQVAVLANDLAEIRKAIQKERPEEDGFVAAAGSLWQKLMLFGKAAAGVAELGGGLRFIADSLGWKLSLPLL